MRDLRHLKILVKHTKTAIERNGNNSIAKAFSQQLKKLEKEINNLKKKGNKNVRKKRKS